MANINLISIMQRGLKKKKKEETNPKFKKNNIAININFKSISSIYKGGQLYQTWSHVTPEMFGVIG